MSLAVCPETMRGHAKAVLDGEYALPRGYELEDPGSLRVLDVGANIGAFSVWAQRTWPGCHVTAYEPIPANARMFRENCPEIKLYEAAVVGATDGDVVEMRLGLNNCGEASLYDLGEQSQERVSVPTIAAWTLPPADAIKVDTEGSELRILAGWPHLKHASVVMLEWHRSGDRWALGHLLDRKGFDCVRDEKRHADRGIMVWVK